MRCAHLFTRYLVAQIRGHTDYLHSTESNHIAILTLRMPFYTGHFFFSLLSYVDNTAYTLHERWISWFLASLKVAANCEMLVVWIARHIGPFRAAEHLTHWTFISLSRLIFVFARRLQRARLRVLYTFTCIHLHLHIFFSRCALHSVREKFFYIISC